MSCKTARCVCQVAGRNCVSCRCLVRCANVAPQTRQYEKRKTQGRPLGREGKQKGKRRRGSGKGGQNRARAQGTGTGKENDTRRSNAPPLHMWPGTSDKEKELGDKATRGKLDGEGESGN